MNQNSKELDYFENHCYKLNRILLSIIKLWPYDSETIFAKFHRVFIFIMTLSIVCVQLMTFYTFKFSMDLFLMVFSYALPTFTCFIQYYLIYMKLNNVKQIWKHICEDYIALKDETERKIIQQYSQLATDTTLRITVLIIVGFGLYVLLEISPILLDIVLPLTETRPRKLHALTEYFIDIGTYFHPILCHWLIGTFLDFIIFIALCMFHMMYVHHICGLLKTACYRIQHSLDKCAAPNSQMQEYMTVQRISNAVQIHKEALKHIDFWLSTFLTYMTIGMIGTVASLTLNLFRLCKSITSLQSMEEIMTSAMLAGIEFITIFIINNHPQKIIDHHNEIFDTVYNVRWYESSIKIQKLLLLIMEKTTKAYVINIGYIFTASLENFTKLASMPISYFTVLYSVTK